METNTTTMKKVYSDQDGAALFALKLLSDKYETDFVIDEGAKPFNEVFGARDVYVFAANCVVGEGAGQGCIIWISSLGEAMDDFAANFVRTEAEKPFNERLAVAADISSFSAVFCGTRTSASLPGEISLNKYMELCPEAKVSCIVDLTAELDTGQQAEHIHALIESLLTIGFPFDLRVRDKGVTIFVNKFLSGQSRWTVDRLEAEIKINVRHYERHF